jgi:gallate dioxygenase
MATVVAGFSVPHTPYLPATLAKDPGAPDAALFAAVRLQVEAVAPDVLVVFDCDHFNTFFLEGVPTFAVAAVDAFAGPNDEAPVAERVVPSHRRLGAAIHAHGVDHGFDLVRTERLTVDHSIMVPLHFLTPGNDVPVVPVFVNGLAPPIPRAARAHALGAMVGDAVRAFPEELRVAFLATGSINHEVGGPRINEGELWGAPDPGWLDHVVTRLRGAEVATLIDEATPERLAAVGNVAGELLCILAMLGAVGDLAPAFLEPQPGLGHAYGAWLVEAGR